MPSSDDAPDAILPVLTRRQAARFHVLVRRALTRHATVHEWNDDDSYTVNEAVFGLANLAAVVAALPGDEWAAAIDRHVDLFVTTQEGPLPPASPDMVLPRLRRTGDDHSDGYPRRLTDGLDIILALDYPQFVVELDTLESLTHLGTADEMWDVAMANLRALPEPESHITVPDGSTLRSTVWDFYFDDYFGPSRLLLGNEFCRRYVPTSAHGLLVAIPDRHSMLVTPVTDDLLPQCGELAAITQSLFETSPGATSPCVYHLDENGEITEVAYITTDGSTYFRPNATLATLLGLPPEHDVDRGP